MTQTTFTQTWHKHDGGPCPVDPMTPVMYIMSNGVRSEYPTTAGIIFWDHLPAVTDIIAYTTDIFDGVFPEPVEEDPRLVEIRENACRKAREQQAEYRELCERRKAAGWTFEGGRDGRGWIAPDHIPDAGKKVEPTRGDRMPNYEDEAADRYALQFIDYYEPTRGARCDGAFPGCADCQSEFLP